MILEMKRYWYKKQKPMKTDSTVSSYSSKNEVRRKKKLTCEPRVYSCRMIIKSTESQNLKRGDGLFHKLINYI